MDIVHIPYKIVQVNIKCPKCDGHLQWCGHTGITNFKNVNIHYCNKCSHMETMVSDITYPYFDYVKDDK